MNFSSDYAALLSAALLLGFCSTGGAEGLVQVYQIALQADPEYRRAQAEYQAALELLPQARAVLLPELSATLQAEWHKQDVQADFNPNRGSRFSFENHNYGLQLRQPIYHRERQLGVHQARRRQQEAAARFEGVRQDLVLRVAQAYFEVLVRQEELGFTRSLERSLKRQLEQAEQRLEVGFGTITDTEEARAGHDLAVAMGIQAMNDLAIAREDLRVLTDVHISTLETLDMQFPLQAPDPQGPEEWERIALAQSPEVRMAQYGLEFRALEVSRRRSAHHPTVDIVSRVGASGTGGRFGRTDTEDVSVGIQLQLPLLQGGGVVAGTREAVQLQRGARYGLEYARRQARRNARQSYLNVLSGSSRIQALQQAVLSSETALEATHAGFEVGTRTSVDVVVAERTLSAARRDHVVARYDFLLDSLRLKRAAGILSAEDLQAINHWLVQE